MSSIRGKAAIVGVGISEHGEVPGWTHFELMAQAVERACADAGIKSKDIDGLFTMITPADMPISMTAEYLGLRPKVLEGSMLGGSSFVNFLSWRPSPSMPDCARSH